MRSTGTPDLLRSHLALSSAGLLLHGLAALPAFLVALAPAGFSLSHAPGVLLPALLGAAIVELPVLILWYRPAAALDALDSNTVYAQNPVLAAGVVRLLSLPFRSVLRVALVRAPVFAAATHLLAAAELPALPSPAAAREFWLLALTLVPLAGAALEFFVLPERIAGRYGHLLAYRPSLPPQWQARIVHLPTALRLTALVLALAVAPMLAVGVGPDRTLHTLILGGLVLLTALWVIALMHRDEERSTRALLDSLHRIVHHRAEAAVPVLPAGAHTPLVDGFGRMAVELRERAFIHDTFGKHVPRSIVQAVLRDGIRLQGERREIALLRVGLRDFRTLAARRTPAGVVGLLNSYLGTVIAAAHHYGGTVDSVNGDQVLIVFGAPVVLDAPVDRALHVAFDIRRCLERRTGTSGAGPPLRMAAGVHFGPVVAGHIGAAGRWEYTFVGDAVEAVRSIAAAAEAAGADLLLSEAAQTLAGPGFTFTPAAGDLRMPDGTPLSLLAAEPSADSPASSASPCVSS